jgi:2-dehydro-3-deoxygluconokinase
MKNGLIIPPNGALDFLSLGALVHRLDPGIIPFRKASECQIHVSGGEFNCAANLADCFRLQTGIATAIVDYPVGDLIAERVRAMGVKPFYKRFKHNGVNGPNMAAVYSDRGQGVRAPVVFYNRANEAGALLKPGDFDWRAIFGAGVRWFHSGGIFAALSATTGELIVEAMKAAKAAGAVTSFDLNYRAKLWDVWGGHERALLVIARIVEHVDILVGNEEDLQMGLGVAGPEVAAKSKLDPSAFFGTRWWPSTPMSRSSPRRCGKSTPATGTVGVQWPGSTARPIRLPPPSSMSTIGSAAATVSPQGSSTVS